MIRRVGAGLVPYAAAAGGVLGFGLLYRGVAAGDVATVLTGLALILLGLDRAGRALAASMMLHAGAGQRGEGGDGGGPGAGAGAGPGAEAEAGSGAAVRSGAGAEAEAAEAAASGGAGTITTASRATVRASRMRRAQHQQHGPRRNAGGQEVSDRE